jgi:hypothetical protein
MPKKSARAARPGQQRSKEEQWRKRMAAQARTSTTSPVSSSAARSAVAEVEEAEYSDEELRETTIVPASASTVSRSRATAPVRPEASRAQMSAAQRRASSYTPRTGPRARLQANTLSIEEEMQFVRKDIRRLVILTAICLAVIIALSFVVPSIVR